MTGLVYWTLLTLTAVPVWLATQAKGVKVVSLTSPQSHDQASNKQMFFGGRKYKKADEKNENTYRLQTKERIKQGCRS